MIFSNQVGLKLFAMIHVLFPYGSSCCSIPHQFISISILWQDLYDIFGFVWVVAWDVCVDGPWFDVDVLVINQLQLERALRAMQEEHAQVKSSSHTKLAKANALVDGIEEKSSVVDKKLLDAEAKLAEINRKNAELDMKLK